MAGKGIQYFKKRARRSAISSIISVSLVLYVIGLFGMMAIHAGVLSNYVRENLVLQVYMDENAPSKEIQRLYQSFKTKAYVKKVQYVSKERAAKILSKDLGEDFVGFLDYNPLMASISLHMKAEYAQVDSIRLIRSQLMQEGAGSIKEVFYQENALQLLNQNLSRILAIFLGFSILLGFASLILINNAVRLSLFSERFSIKTMQLVGATAGFIRKPFLMKSLLNGFFAGIVSIVLLLLTLASSMHEIPEIANLRNDWLMGILFAGLCVLGIVMTFSSTLLAINRYLSTQIEDLY